MSTISDTNQWCYFKFLVCTRDVGAGAALSHCVARCHRQAVWIYYVDEAGQGGGVAKLRALYPRTVIDVIPRGKH